MRKVPRTREVGHLVYLLATGLLILVIINNILLEQFPSRLSEANPFVLGLSIEEWNANLSDVVATEKVDNWSFILSSVGSAVFVFLDYIYLDDIAPPSQEFCVNSVTLFRDDPLNFTFTPYENIDSSFGKLSIAPNKYVFTFDVPGCIEKGTKYILGHQLLGFIKENVYAELWPLRRNGNAALGFFPFDMKEIKLNFNLRVQGESGTTASILRPGIEILEAQNIAYEWIPSFIMLPDQQPALRYARPFYYKAIFLVFIMIMMILFPLLSNRKFKTENVMQIYVGIVFGLAGTRAILVPTFVQSSLLVDMTISIIFLLALGGMVNLLVAEQMNLVTKANLRIVGVGNGKADKEWVQIENSGSASIDMTGWKLFDKKGHKFVFPEFRLKGKQVFGKSRSVRVWTGFGENDTSNLYWGKKRAVWNDKAESIYLVDSADTVIFVYSYHDI